MIIDPNDPAHIESPKVAEARAAAEAAGVVVKDEIDAPPSYSDVPPTFEGPAGGSRIPPQAGGSAIPVAPQQPATNFVFVNLDNNKVRGSYHIDPTLSIPAALLTPCVAALPADQRKNIHLFSKNGSVDADIMVSAAHGERDAKRQQRAKLVAGSANGSVTLRVRRAKSNVVLSATPVHISAASRNGSVRISLPESFTGPLTLTAHNGSIRLSPGLTARLSTDSHDQHTKKCFVGDMSLYEGDEWYGDELVVEAHNGSVTVDEAEGSELQSIQVGKEKGKGLFSRMFG